MYALFGPHVVVVVVGDFEGGPASNNNNTSASKRVLFLYIHTYPRVVYVSAPGCTLNGHTGMNRTFLS